MSTADSRAMTGQAARRWQDPALPASERVDALLAEMTVAEKVAQLGSRWLGNFMGHDADDVGDGADDVIGSGDGEGERPQVAPLEDLFRDAGAFPSRRRRATGSATSRACTAAVP